MAVALQMRFLARILLPTRLPIHLPSSLGLSQHFRLSKLSTTRRNLQFRQAKVMGIVSIKLEEDDFEANRPTTSVNETLLWRINKTMNRASKWVVVIGVVILLAIKHDEHVVWALLGSALNGGNSKLLKKIINQPRPSDLKEGPGMPSSHGQATGYLGIYAASGLLAGYGQQLFNIVAACVVVLLAVYLAWLRIEEGLHTTAQVVVGFGVGSATAFFWLWLWHALVKSAVFSSPLAHTSLYIAFSCGAVGFYMLSFRSWKLEDV